MYKWRDNKLMVKKHKITLSSILLILCSGVLLSSLAGYVLLEKEKNMIRHDFETDVKQRAVSLHRELVINLEIAQALSILFRGDSLPSYEQFNNEANLILNRFEGIHALSWDPKVTHSQRSNFELQQQHFLPGFTISERQEQGRMITAGKRDVYYPILYISPYAGNQTAIGFDLGSNPTRLTALQASRNSAKAIATGSINLVQGQKKSKAFITFIPIFRWLSSTQQQRANNLRGYISAVFKIKEIFERATLSEKPLGINMKLVDITEPDNISLLHQHNSRTDSPVIGSLLYNNELPELWSRNWRIEGVATQYYIDKRQSYLAQSIFITGVIFTFFICIYLYFISQQSKRIKQSVFQETKYLSKANMKLKRLSDIDALTEVANRRRMDSYLKLQWLNALKNQQSLSVLLIDIDHFKLYNDNYGHPAGDKVLREVAQTIDRITKRNDDLTARFGGEEFALILSSDSDAQELAKQCLQAILDLKIKHEYSDTCNILTISIGGCSTIPISRRGYESLINSADKALYEAKSAGRNCIKYMPEVDHSIIHMENGFK